MSYAGPLTQPQPQTKIKPSSAWIWIGSLMMVASFFAFVILMALSVINFANAVTDITLVEPGERVRMQLDAHRYLVYTETYASEPTVSVTGDSGDVLVVQSTSTNSTTVDGDYWSSRYYFDIETSGSYVISNGGTDVISVGPGNFGEIAQGFGVAFAVGALIGVPGFILVIVTAIRRRGARKRLRASTGTYSGVPYNATPGPYGGPPPGSYGAPPPTNLGGPPPQPFGAPPPSPNSPPPSNWQR